MSATSARAADVPTRGATRVDRLLAAVPIAALALGILVFYLVEAWTRKTPWVFTDELEWTQISRAINETGHAARRGQPIYFKSLYAFLIAPFWWIHSTESAYAAIKYANAIVMPLAAVPTYLLARMLVARRIAIVVAVLAVAIPGMSYATSLVPEVLAYPWYALSSWLIVRALTTRRRLDWAVAIGVSIVAGLIRWPQFATVPSSFALAAMGLWLTGPSGRAFRRGWTRSDTFAALVLLAGLLIFFNRVVLQHEQIWQVSTQYWKNRMVDLGLNAGLAFTVGMGVLPVIGGLASLRLPERRGQPAYRAFAAYLGASILCISLYTAVKAAYLSTVFATLTEERNMIYLSPLMLTGTALVFTARRIDWRLVGAASAFVLFLVFFKHLHLEFPYLEAPGFAILTIFNRHFRWDVGDLHLVIVGALAVSLALLVLRRRTAAVALAVLLGSAWMLTAEVGATVAIDNLANRFREHLPTPLDWVDRDTGGQSVTYLGQEIVDPNGLWLTEFWNRSIRHVDSLDGTAPGPGPTATPNLVDADGTLSGNNGDPYVLTGNGVTLQAPLVDHWGAMRLYRPAGPWRLFDAEQQVYSDGWAPDWCSYTYFKPGQHGTLLVGLSRAGFNGSAPTGHARVTVGTVRIDQNQQPAFAHVFADRRLLVRNGSDQVLRIHVARTPVRVEIRVSPTFHASASDPRNLGAQVFFKFEPDRKG
jgi:hypothetical protein